MIRVRFRWRDLWVGAYVEPPDYAELRQRTFVCLVPCLPLVISRKLAAFK